jgi:predicted RNA-binding Zn-ribbon protein involved in translation (DUF1610 family)
MSDDQGQEAAPAGVLTVERTDACPACLGEGQLRPGVGPFGGVVAQEQECPQCHGAQTITHRVHLSTEEAAAWRAEEARRRREAAAMRRERAAVEELLASGVLEAEAEYERELELRRTARRRKERERGAERGAAKCTTCEVPLSDGDSPSSWGWECPTCGKPARPTRRDIHLALGRMIEERAHGDEVLAGIVAALDGPWGKRAVRAALKCDGRFSRQKAEGFGEDWWVW